MATETIVYHKTYGVERITWKGHLRWCVRCNGRAITDLHFAKREFALERAKHFVRSCHRDFVDFQGRQAHFTFGPESNYA